MTMLPPIPVAMPLAVAGLLLVFGKLLPRRVPDVLAMLAALAAAGICAAMVVHIASGAASGPLVYWFGGWTPRAGQAIGIDFVVDPVGGSVAAFIGLLFAATLLFAWGYFDEVHAHFHVLMLLFMAGMIGFCLTHDLFNLFVWFEVMSVAAFALTGYQLRSSALEGALNFTVVNTIGSYLILGGIGLIYAEVGALDMSALGVGVARAPTDPVIAASFTLLAVGFLIKAAQAPFHFWLSDAHAVAPSPVSVIFSGAMVALGLFGVARVFFTIFSAAPGIDHVVRTLLLGMGAASTVIGGVLALSQRHLKRLLAFSTISHVGIMLIGLALLSRAGLSGMLVYLVGHGLVKGALFMVAGILLATRGGIDEIGLRGLGKGIRPAGIAMAVGGLLLAGLPFGLMDEGTQLIAHAARDAGASWISAVIVIGAVCTGAAVLRAAGRIFLGLGPVAGGEERSPSDDEQEKADRPLWLMMLPTGLLLLLSLPGSHEAGRFAWRATTAFMQPDSSLVLSGVPRPVQASPGEVPNSDSLLLPWVSVLLAVALAAANLSRHCAPRWLTGALDRVTGPPLDGLRMLHSGLVGDYVMWIMVGLALFTVAFALA
jgi:multicomponent Na+:H+ antiporter subunit D